MATEGMIQVRDGNSLTTGSLASNVATNRAEQSLLQGLNIDGKDTYPRSVQCQRFYCAEGFQVGNNIQIADGTIKAQHLIQTETVIATSVQIGAALITEDHIDVPSLSAISANLGTITSGRIDVGAGGVQVGDADAGIYIGTNLIRAKYSGATTFELDGATGVLTASKLNLTSDEDSVVTLLDGEVYIGESVVIGASPGRSAGDLIRVFPPSGTEPTTGMAAGDIWFDTSDGYKPHRYSGTAWVEVQDTGAAAGRTSIQPGNGVAVNGSKYITTIDLSSGLVVRTSDSTAKTQITSNGMAIYNSAGTLVVQADHTNGLWVNNTTEDNPGVTERLTLAYGGEEVGGIAAGYTGEIVVKSDDKIILSIGTFDASGATEFAILGDNVFFSPVFKGTYQSLDGTAGLSSGTRTWVDKNDVTHTVTIKDGIITAWGVG